MGRSNGIHKIHKIGTAVWQQCRTAVSWFPFRLLLLFHGSTRMPNRTRLTQWTCCHFCADCVWRGIKIWPCQGSDSTSNSKSKTDRKAKSRMKKN
ncbi:GM14379 [Drosophila sechellia]|uniref:GM14379 n=1 Tax=Drosophila sechellia TaxID=7238 RepID=B4HXP9_DROSE|nr:GM14379 [Drosophila sechellia]